MSGAWVLPVMSVGMMESHADRRLPHEQSIELYVTALNPALTIAANALRVAALGEVVA